MESFASERDYPLVSVSEAAQLTREDFIDYEGHIGNRDARLRCNNYLGKEIANIYKENRIQ